MRIVLFPNRFIANDNRRYEKNMNFKMEMVKGKEKSGKMTLRNVLKWKRVCKI